MMENETKNVKISKRHHETLKTYCDEKGIKIYKMLERLIDENCKPKKRDLYGE
jgi:hypothetical protein